MTVFDVKSYWETRYKDGGNSGLGSQTNIRQYKLDKLNSYVAEYGISSILDLGCGDGRQVSGLDVAKYTGVDLSPSILAACRVRHADKPNWRFLEYENLPDTKVDATLSLDVVYHLVNDAMYREYIARLAKHALRYIIVFSTTEECPSSVLHVKHRAYLTDMLADKNLSIVKSETTPDGLKTAAKFVIIKRTI